MVRAAKIRAAKNGGFTLIELMIVVAIIGILAVLAVVGFHSVITNSRTSEATGFVGTIRLGQESYKAETGTYASISSGAGDLCPANPMVAGSTAANGRKIAWDPGCGNGANKPWSTIPSVPDGPVRFGYATMATGSCPSITGLTVGSTTMPPPVTLAPAGMPCHWILANGDTDGDGVAAQIMGTSLSKDVTVVDER
jgi:type IV pilus assembly protein PilA